jgi:hypothetical protein
MSLKSDAFNTMANDGTFIGTFSPIHLKFRSESPMDVSRKGGALGSQAGLELTRAGRLYANDTNTASADGYTSLNLKASHAGESAAAP